MTASTTVRWGFVGLGRIANSMAQILTQTEAGRLTACASRSKDKAEAFASRFGAGRAFDSWKDMLKWDGIDAVYVATPTHQREEICVAAANAGKHVLGEKPFLSTPSLGRIISACKENHVAFMDGTHFTHHPRTISLQNDLCTLTGERRDLHSVLQFKIHDKTNIRMQPALEPMGAIGDLGWYNMRSAVEYIDPDAKVKTLTATIRRDRDTNAITGCAGVIAFHENSTLTWRCGFDAGSNRGDLTIEGSNGCVRMDTFHVPNEDGFASYAYNNNNDPEHPADAHIKVNAPLKQATSMFEAFAAQTADPTLRDLSINKSTRTQALLDAIYKSGLSNERT